MKCLFLVVTKCLNNEIDLYQSDFNTFTDIDRFSLFFSKNSLARINSGIETLDAMVVDGKCS